MFEGWSTGRSIFSATPSTRKCSRRWAAWARGMARPASEGCVRSLLVAAGVLAVLFIPWQRLRRFRRLRRLDGVFGRVESLERRLRMILRAATRRWRWGVGLLAVVAVCVGSQRLWRTAAQSLAAAAQVSELTFPEPFESGSCRKGRCSRRGRSRKESIPSTFHRMAGSERRCGCRPDNRFPLWSSSSRPTARPWPVPKVSPWWSFWSSLPSRARASTTRRSFS